MKQKLSSAKEKRIEIRLSTEEKTLLQNIVTNTTVLLRNLYEKSLPKNCTLLPNILLPIYFYSKIRFII